MQPSDIFITTVSWKGGGKKRPVLVVLKNDTKISAYPITSKYENKSEKIKSKYFKIEEWDKAGLDKQSYIDTGNRINIPVAITEKTKPIGKLTTLDMQRLIDFLS